MFSKLKKGDICSETQFYTVDKKSGDKVQLTNDDGEPIVVDRGYVDKCLVSADQYGKSDVEKMTRTELAEKFISSANVAMTVSFNKQVKETDVVAEIKDAYENSTPKEALKAMKKAVKRGLTGEERVMIGRHYGSVDDFGRITFIDMKAAKTAGKDYDTRSRKVDPRGLNWFICRGVKHQVK